MNVILKKRILIIIIIIIIGFGTYYLMNSKSESKKSDLLNHSSTMNIIVKEKIKENTNDIRYLVKVKNLYDPYQEYTIYVDDERVWNLIKENGKYFVNTSWESTNSLPDITDQETELLQIEDISSK